MPSLFFKDMYEEYKNCNLCPRNCGVNRCEGYGFCGEKTNIRIARAALHYWEEPCISGKDGSGTVFFSGCSLKCVFCQNSELAFGKSGKSISEERLAEIFYELRDKGANNINLVTADHFAPQVAKVIRSVKIKGFALPFILNTGGYISAKQLKIFDGIIDVYLSDFKYFSSFVSKKYSGAYDYPTIVEKAIDEMIRQQPKIEFNTDGLIQKGIIIRHLILPEHTDDSKKIIKYLYERYKDGIYISIMNQYTPFDARKLKFPELNRRVTAEEYADVVEFVLNLGVKNAYIQEEGTAEESFIPMFDYEGV